MALEPKTKARGFAPGSHKHPRMLKKILYIVIGALVALFIFVGAVSIFNNSLGFQNVAIIDLILTMTAGFLCSKKFASNEIVKYLSLGALYGALVYLVLIFIGKTIVFSLLSGITN